MNYQLKQLANQNTAIMYCALLPSMLAFLAVAEKIPDTGWWPWDVLGHYLNHYLIAM